MLLNKLINSWSTLLFAIKYSVIQFESPLNQKVQMAYRICKKYFSERIRKNFLVQSSIWERIWKDWENLDVYQPTDTVFVCCLVVLKLYALQDRILQCPEFFFTWHFFLHDLSWSSCNSTISLLINIGFLHQIRLHTSFERPSSLDVKKSCVCQSTFYGTFEDLSLSPYTTMQLWSISSILEGRSQVLIPGLATDVFSIQQKAHRMKYWEVTSEMTRVAKL